MRVQTSAAEAQMVPINVEADPTEEVAQLMSVADEFVREVMASRGNPGSDALQRMAHLLNEFDGISGDLQTSVRYKNRCGVLNHKDDQPWEKSGEKT